MTEFAVASRLTGMREVRAARDGSAAAITRFHRGRGAGAGGGTLVRSARRGEDHWPAVVGPERDRDL